MEHRDIALKQFTEGIPRDYQDSQGPRETQRPQITKKGQDPSNG